MRLLIHDFLSLMRERDELDKLLPDLLRAMGYQIVKIAFRGEVENGVDVAALRREHGKSRLYLFQIKAGDLTPEMWNGGPNSVRASLEDIRDVSFEDSGNPRLRHTDRVVVVVHNGVLRENVRQKWEGYQKNYPYELQRWDVDHLTELVQSHLLNEYLLPKNLRHLLSKTLAFIDVEGYEFEHFRELLRQYFMVPQETPKPREVRRRFVTLRVIMSLVHQHAFVAGNLRPSLVLSEAATLAGWNWVVQMSDRRASTLQESAKTVQLWFEHMGQYVEKIAPLLEIEDGLFLFGHHEIVEYPLRAMNIIATLGLAAIAAKMWEMEEIAQRVAKVLVRCLENNLHGASRPLLDNHLVAVFLGLFGLWCTGHRTVAGLWLQELLGNLVLRKKSDRPMPELYNRLGLVVEHAASGIRPSTYEDSSSTLVYFLFEMCLLLGAVDIYQQFSRSFVGLNHQVWNPPSDVEKTLFWSEVRSGTAETNITLPDSFSEFAAQVKARHATFNDPKLDSVSLAHYVLVLLACKHFQTPIPPTMWRTWIPWESFEQSARACLS